MGRRLDVALWVGLVAVSGLALTAVSGPDMFVGYLTVTTACCWIALLVTAAVRRRGRLVAATVAAPVLVLGLGALGAPSLVRMASSQAAIADAGQNVLNGGAPRRAGLYGVQDSWINDDGCVVLETQANFLDTYGIAYCPDGVTTTDRTLQHRVGNVYDYADED